MIIYSALYPFFAHLELLPGVDAWETIYIPEHIKHENAILILHGGSDISPSLYGEKPNKYTYATEQLSNRDTIEVALYHKAISMKIPIFGICRGAQLLCAMQGGKLIQQVTNHESTHKITTKEAEIFKSNSAHHQMMYPFKIDHELLTWSTKNISTEYLGEDEKEIEISIEPEMVYFPHINSLGIQGHPEWLGEKNPLVQHTLKTIQKKVLSNVIWS